MGRCGKAVCEPWELLFTSLLTSTSNFAGLPALIVAWKQDLRFETTFIAFGLLTSFFYHLCEPTRIQVYGMNEGNWHRLDNVSAIMCFANLFIYLMDNRNFLLSDYLKYIMLCWILLQQESGPWKLSNTIIPIATSALFPIIKFAVVLRKLPEYNWRNFFIGWAFMTTAFIFFARGLQDETDYLRSFHSCWHILVGVASFYLWQTVPKKLSAS